MEQIIDLFLGTPIWAIFIFTFLIVYIAFESGVFLGEKHRKNAEKEDRSPIGSMVAATLGLLAFLLAFTFGIAASKFDERRNLVVEEANAIGTTYLRAGYLKESFRESVKDLLKEYVAIRLDAIKPGKITEGIKKSEEIQDKLWLHATLIAEKNPNSVVEGLFIQSLNEMIDLHAKRIYLGLRVRIPIIIWGVLYFVTMLSIGCLGYQFGLFHTRYIGITFLLILTFSSVIILIVDLDRPQEGFIHVTQQSLIDLMEKFNQNPKL